MCYSIYVHIFILNNIINDNKTLCRVKASESVTSILAADRKQAQVQEGNLFIDLPPFERFAKY